MNAKLMIWLSVIHWAFGQNWGENLQAFMQFVNDVVTALGKARH